MAPWLDEDGFAHEGFDVVVTGALAKCCTQVELLIAQEAEMELAVRGQPHAITGRTERLADRRDEADRSLAAGDTIGASRIAAEPSDEFERSKDGFQPRDDLAR